MKSHNVTDDHSNESSIVVLFNAWHCVYFFFSILAIPLLMSGYCSACRQVPELTPLPALDLPNPVITTAGDWRPAPTLSKPEKFV